MQQAQPVYMQTYDAIMGSVFNLPLMAMVGAAPSASVVNGAAAVGWMCVTAGTGVFFSSSGPSSF